MYKILILLKLTSEYSARPPLWMVHNNYNTTLCMRSKTDTLTQYHPVCSMTVVLARFHAWKILEGPLSVPGMQCIAAKTTSSRCGGLSGKVSEPFRCCTNTCSLSFRRGFLIGFVLFSSLSSTKLLHCSIPLVMTEQTAAMATASTMTLESRAKRHPPSSSNGFPASSEETTSASTMTLESKAKRHPPSSSLKWISSFLKRARTLGSAEGFLRFMALLMVIHAVCTFVCHAMLKPVLSKRTICGPAVTHRLKAAGLTRQVLRTAPPFPSTIALHCLCAWSCACAQQIHYCERLDTLMGASDLTHVTKVYW